MVNAPLLEDTIVHLRTHPELHCQQYFYEMTEFGVAACLGGRALLLAGYEAVLPLREGATSCMAEHPFTKERVGVWSEAKWLLGLEHAWAVNLFSCANTRQMLERKVKDLLNGSPLEKYSDLLECS